MDRRSKEDATGALEGALPDQELQERVHCTLELVLYMETATQDDNTGMKAAAVDD